MCAPCRFIGVFSVIWELWFRSVYSICTNMAESVSLLISELTKTAEDTAADSSKNYRTISDVSDVLPL